MCVYIEREFSGYLYTYSVKEIYIIKLSTHKKPPSVCVCTNCLTVLDTGKWKR